MVVQLLIIDFFVDILFHISFKLYMNNDNNNTPLPNQVYVQHIPNTQKTQTIITKESYIKNFLMPYIVRFIFVFIPLTVFYLILIYINEHPVHKYILNPLCLFKPSIPNHLLIEGYNIPTNHFQQLFPTFLKYYSDPYKNVLGNIGVGMGLSITFYLLFSGKLRIFEKLFYMKLIFPRFTKVLLGLIFMPILYWAFGPVVKNLLIETNLMHFEQNYIDIGKNLIKNFIKF